MRELTFRAYNKDKKAWEYFTFSNIATYLTELQKHLLDGDTFYQYTGLKDKNSKECYWDDLVKWGKAIYKVVWNEEEGIAVLQYVSGQEVFKYLRISQIKQGEIIGNVHETAENLELLEKASK